MRWEEFAAFAGDGEEQYESTIDLDLSLLSKPKVQLRVCVCEEGRYSKHRSLFLYPAVELFTEDNVEQREDYYRILEVKYDANEECIRSNYIRLALKWHPDKKKGEDCSTSRFQEINEAYKVLSDPAKRRAYDREILPQIEDHNFIDYLNRHKGLILTCNGLGIR